MSHSEQPVLGLDYWHCAQAVSTYSVAKVEHAGDERLPKVLPGFPGKWLFVLQGQVNGRNLSFVEDSKCWPVISKFTQFISDNMMRGGYVLE